jgi:hypothetical protein
MIFSIVFLLKKLAQKMETPQKNALSGNLTIISCCALDNAPCRSVRGEKVVDCGV